VSVRGQGSPAAVARGQGSLPAVARVQGTLAAARWQGIPAMATARGSRDSGGGRRHARAD
jgi:hypothetical protein